MATTTTSDCINVKLFNNIEKLKADGSNWDIWKWHTYLALQHQELMDYIEGTAPKPTPVPASSTGKDPSTSTPIISNADQI